MIEKLIFPTENLQISPNWIFDQSALVNFGLWRHRAFKNSERVATIATHDPVTSEKAQLVQIILILLATTCLAGKF